MGFFLPTPILQQQPAFLAGAALGHPLARNLRFAGYSASGRFYDAVTKQASTQGSTANRAARRSIDGNLGLAFEAKTTQMTFPVLSTGFDQVAGPCTIFVEGSVLTNNSNQLVAESFSPGTGNGFGLKFDDNDQVTNGFYLFLNNNNSTPSNFDDLGTNSETFRHRVAITLDGANANLYCKNKLARQVANTGLPTADTTRQTRILTGTGGAVALVLVWDRVLSLEEFKALFFNPWQVFQAPRKKFFFKAITGSLQALSGSFIGTDESTNPGAVAFSTSLNGAAIATDEAARAGAAAITTRVIPGAAITPDEKVNQGAISSLPFTALWTQKSSTNFSSVVPSPVPAPGGTAYLNVMATWSTGCFGAGYFVIARQGGHTDYSGNEVYGLRISDWTPLLLRNPCSAAIVAASDSIESSGCYATSTAGTTPDPQQPRSTHGYGTHVWSTVKSKVACLGSSGMYPSGQLGNATIRFYDPVANTWETGPDILTPFNAAYSACCEDTNGDLWFIGQGNAGRLNRINVTTGVVTEFGNAFMFALQDYYRTGVYDPVRNFFWIFGGNTTAHEVGYWDLNNTSGNIDFTPVTVTGVTSIMNQPAPGAEWHPGSSLIILWSGGTTVHAFDPATFKCMAVTLNPSNSTTPSAAQPDGTYGRFRRIGPDTFLGVNAMDENFFQLQLGGPAQSLSGTATSTDEQARAGTLTVPAGLSGASIKTDESTPAGQAAPQAIGLAGLFLSTDEKTNAGTLAALFALAGAAVGTDEKMNPGALAVAAVALAGLAVFTDEIARAGTVSLGGQALAGGAILPDEVTNPGALALGSFAMTGAAVKPDEATFPGSLAVVIALAGQAIATDEKTNAGTLAAFFAITGSFVLPDEKVNVGAVAVGALALPGAQVATDEKANPGVVSLGGQVLSGSFTSTDEQARPGATGLGAFSLSGAFFSTDEQARAGGLAMLAALQGAGILTDEQARAGAVAASSGFSLGGSAIAPDELTNPGAVVPTATAMLGASIKTDERTPGGVLAALYAMVGSYLATDETTRLGITTVGGVTLLGVYTKTDELISQAVLVQGQLIIKTLRSRGAYHTSVRKVGAYG